MSVVDLDSITGAVDLSRIDPRTLIGKGRVGLLDSTGTYDVDRYGCLLYTSDAADE